MQDSGIHKIKTTFDFSPYHTNAYLLELKDGLFLFDTGIKNNATIEFLKKHIEKIGKIDGIILSHGHLDHAGCASIISNYYNVPIFISLEEKDRIGINFNERLNKRVDKIYKISKFLGLNKRNVEILQERTNYYKNLLEPIEFCFNVEKLNLSEVEIIKLPGHTSGCIGLYIKDSKLLLSGDALLKDGISPFFDPELLEDSLAIYLNSLNKIKKMEVKAILPGHGDKITDPMKIIDKHIKYIENNQKKMKELLQQNYKISDVYQKIFPENQNPLITLSEIIHCLESLKIPILQNLKDLLSE